MNMLNRFTSLIAIIIFSLATIQAQEKIFEEYKNLFTTPKGYVAGYTMTPPTIDGDIDNPEWADVEWTDLFQDIEGDLKPIPHHDTRVKIMWDSTHLYFAAKMVEPHVWAKLTKRDEIVFFDNDFEIFLNPNNTTHQYFEVEINALNNIFDLYMNKPYREGSGALFSWDAQGMKHAVKVDGTLNDPSDIDEGWTVEIAIPLRALTVGNDVHIPKDGDVWRMNFSRVQWDTHVENSEYIKDRGANGNVKSERNWVWTPQGVIDIHLPERWGYLQFSINKVGEKLPQFERPYEEKMRDYLWLIYYKQRDYRAKYGEYATSLEALNMPTEVIIDKLKNTLELDAMSSMFLGTINNNNKKTQINNEGLIIIK